MAGSTLTYVEMYNLLRELASKTPAYDVGGDLQVCIYCYAQDYGLHNPEEHTEDCPWRRAKAAVK